MEDPKSIAQTLSKPQPKKLVILNGGKKRNSAKSAASPVQSTSGDATTATKRKRKAKKPYLVRDSCIIMSVQLISHSLKISSCPM